MWVWDWEGASLPACSLLWYVPFKPPSPSPRSLQKPLDSFQHRASLLLAPPPSQSHDTKYMISTFVLHPIEVSLCSKAHPWLLPSVSLLVIGLPTPSRPIPNPNLPIPRTA